MNIIYGGYTKMVNKYNSGMISVIIPNYNNEKFLQRCIESVIGQTYKNLEIIIVDDGSTDNSWNIIEDYSKKDSRIKAYRKNNTGVSDTRNYALEICNGEFIGFVDSDDYIDLNMYSIMIEKLRRYDAQISIISFADNIVRDEQVYVFSSHEAILEMNYGKKFMGHMVLKLIRHELCEKLKFDIEIKVCEDLYFCHDVFLKAETIVFFDKGLYHRTFNPDSAMRCKFNDNFLTCHIASLKIIDFFQKNIPEKMEYAYLTLIRNNLLILNKLALCNEDTNVYKSVIEELRNEILVHNSNSMNSLYSGFEERLKVFFLGCSFHIYKRYVRLRNLLSKLKHMVKTCFNEV